MFKIALKFYQVLRDWVAAALDKLRQPGGVLRATCAALAVLCVVGAVHLYDQRTEIHQLQLVGLKCEAEMAGARGQVAGWDAAVAQIREGLLAEALERERQLERSRMGLAAAEQARAEAERRALDFQRRYESRGMECSAALQLLDTQCAELGGY